MMDRLQRRNPESEEDQGEVITRADGTKAMRVRKRKRRTLQPHKEEQAKTRRMRMIQVSFVLLFLLLIGIVAGGAMIFANSPIFQDRLLNGIITKTGANPELMEFRMSPQTANARVVTLEWPEGNLLRRALIRSPRAEIHPVSFLGNALTGDELRGTQTEIDLSMPSSTAPRAVDTPDEAFMDLRFKRYTSREVKVRIGPKESLLASIAESELTLQTLGKNARPQLLINQGNLAIPGLPKYRISRGHIEFLGEDIEVISLRILHESDDVGRLKLNGIIHPYDVSRTSTLAVQTEELLLEALVGNHLGKTLVGRVDTVESTRSNFFSFTPSLKPNGVLAVDFQNSLTNSFELRGFPAFKLLSRLLDDKWYENPVFNGETSGSFRRENGEVVISDLECENRSRVSVSANLRMTNRRQLSGTMRIGIPNGLLEAAQNRKLEQVFTKEDNGYRWVEIAISGRGDAPQDNFSAIYEDADDAPVHSDSGIPSFEELTQPD